MKGHDCLCWVVVLLGVLRVTDALSCMCRKGRCEQPTDCVAGIVLDACGCCYECARTVNQSCGGLFLLLGKCGDGLYCEPNVGGSERTAAIPDDVAAGVCLPCTGVTRKGCDLVVGGNGIQECQCAESCTKEFLFPTHDVCQKEVNRRQGDHMSHQSLISDSAGVAAADTPNCVGVTCPEYEELFPGDCPSDSWRPPADASVTSADACCGQTNDCVCKEASNCPPQPLCDLGLSSVEVLPPSGRPSSCCALYQCINASTLQCELEGFVYEHGSDVISTAPDAACQRCICIEGVVLCRPAVECPALSSSCSWMSVADGECCPTCRGCVSRTTLAFHAIGETWQEDDCTSCECDNGGSARCYASACSAPRCARPLKIAGHCCPVCGGVNGVEGGTGEEDGDGRLDVITFKLSMTTSADQSANCSTSEDDAAQCESKCGGRLRHDDNGCRMCECGDDTASTTELETTQPTTRLLVSQLQPQEAIMPSTYPNCTDLALLCDGNITCQHGFKSDGTGCSTCECNSCSKLECNLSCPSDEYEQGDAGCPVCQCRVPSSGVGTVPEAESEAEHEGGCLTVLGRSRQNGEMWFDGCRECFCNHGHELCSLIACPLLHCDRPALAAGQCCPTCPESAASSFAVAANITAACLPKKKGRYNSSNHIEDSGSGRADDESSETWHLDPCTACICHRGRALCETERCPPVLCERPIHAAGSCCPHCPEASLSQYRPAVTTLPNYRHGCTSLRGQQTYKHGDVWRVSDCQSCTCQHGQLHCFSQTCPASSSSGDSCSSTVLTKGQCCPTCASVNTAGRLRVCLVDGQVLSHGQEWKTACSQCVCYHGSPQCTLKPCSQLPPSVGCDSSNAKAAQLDPACCHHCNAVKDVERSKGESEPSPPSSEMAVVATLVVLLCVFACVIIALVVVVVKHTLHRSVLTTPASPRLRAIDSLTINNCSAEAALSRCGTKRPKSTNLEFYVDSFRYNNALLKDKECCKPLVDSGGGGGSVSSKNEYAEC